MPHKIRCRCCNVGDLCEVCGSTGYVPSPDPVIEIPEPERLDGAMLAYFQTLAAKMNREDATGHHGGEVSVAEAHLAEELTRRGVSYRQEYRIGPFFADFYFPQADSVIEVDGATYHTDTEKDEARDRYMLDRVIVRVVRVRALRVFSDAGGFLDEQSWLR
jgi:very-short-patch-repair endonuclease